MEVDPPRGALAGIRVLDFSQVIFGPACTAILADHGAEVIKVERPGQGDLARAFGPFLHGLSLSYLSLNRNKKSLAVDLKNPEGKEIIMRLIPTTDVVVSNFRAGVMESLGFGYEELRLANPRLVNAVGSGYGQTGPYAESRKPGHESLAEALSGAMLANAGIDGFPRRLPLPVADFSAGNTLVQGILLALLAREKTGLGQCVEVALLDSILWLEHWALARAEYQIRTGEAREYRNPLDGAVFLTADGYMVITGLFRPNPLRDICKVLGIDDLSADQRFDSVDSMRQHTDELYGLIQEATSQQSTGHWVSALESMDILCAPVNSYLQAMNDPQLLHNQMIQCVEYPELGDFPTIGIPVKLKDTPGSVRTRAPRIGEDTREILRNVGYDESSIERLGHNGTVSCAD